MVAIFRRDSIGGGDGAMSKHLVPLPTYEAVDIGLQVFQLRIKLYVTTIGAVIGTFGGFVMFGNIDKLAWLFPPAGLLSSAYGLMVYRELEQKEELLESLPVWTLSSKTQRLKEFIGAGNYLLPPDELVRENPTIKSYDWNQINDEACGIIIVGNAGSAKTSLAVWLAGKLTEQEPAQIVVCDPHFNDGWKQMGLNPIGDIPLIEKALDELCNELDRRCERKGNGEPIGAPYLLIMDEIGACRERFSNYKRVEKSLKRLGSEGRKFDMILVAIGHSKNVEDMGISAPLRSNFILALCGASARDESKRIWGGKEPKNIAIREWIKSQSYPLILTGAIEATPAIHPTHGHYQQWKKKGNKPVNLLPINQLEPDTLDTQRKTLERLYNKADTPQTHRHTGENLEDLDTPDTQTHTLTCDCGGKAKKNGKTRSGSPRFRCLNCGKSWSN